MLTNFSSLYSGSTDPDGSDVARAYGWFGIIESLANNDVSKYDDITKLPFKQCLLKLCYDIDKNRELKRKRKKNDNVQRNNRVF